MQKRIAVIGSGLSGLVTTYLLHKQFDVTVFEASSYIGGHTHTVDLEIDHQPYAIDFGMVALHKETSPLFFKLLGKLNVAIQESEMSFSFRSDKLALEYNKHQLRTLFSDRYRLLKPAYYQLMRDISRFKKQASQYLLQNIQELTIEEFIHQNGYSLLFAKTYLVPFILSFWSATPAEIMSAQARFIFEFFVQRRLWQKSNRCQWYVVAGGSRHYVDALAADFRHKIALDTKVDYIKRGLHHVIVSVNQREELFDAVVVATHSDQALALLVDPTDNEKEILSAIPYQTVERVLHTDISVLPHKRALWGSLNYCDNDNHQPQLTYYLNRLQNLETDTDFCVSVNQTEKIQPEKIFERLDAAYPFLTDAAQLAQKRYADINGKHNTFYCGAYWGNGFQEAAVRSAVKVCEALGVRKE